MKAQEFFDLTAKVRAAQKTYFRSRLQGDLITSKQLEAQLDMALKEGKLEPDEPTATVHVYTTEEYQMQLDLMENRSDEPTQAEYLKPERDDQS